MTAPARITQDDMTRAAKAVKAAGIERAQIVLDLARAQISIIIGGANAESPVDDGEWSDEDV